MKKFYNWPRVIGIKQQILFFNHYWTDKLLIKYLETNYKRQPGVLHSKHAVLPSTKSKNSTRNRNRSSNESATYNGKQVA